MPRYRYEASGMAADGQTWTTTGVVEVPREGDFPQVPEMAMRASFLQLTRGQAVYGNPGMGCDGPYTFLRLLIERQGEA
jgi:hypothetical protein